MKAKRINDFNYVATSCANVDV